MSSINYLIQRLKPFFLFFILLEFCVRIALSLYGGTQLAGAGIAVPGAYLVGLCFDVMAFAYLAIPIVFIALVLPERIQGTRADRIISSALFFLFTYILIFSATGEWFFWDEFQTRYNFIAVDYLVYTQEVIGNIRESYPVGLLMSVMAVICAVLSFLYYKFAAAKLPVYVPLKHRFGAFATIIACAVFSFVVMKASYAEISQNRYVNELARNGIFELFSAFRNNELDYNKFYLTRPEQEVREFLAAKLGSDKNAASPLMHNVAGKKSAPKYNLVVITVESLSAEYLAEFGNVDKITPNLDQLIPQSLFFSNLYATGTRTVYGLSAITLAVPPVPGNSIVRRPDNGDLFSLGHVLQSKGYATKFIYGGYGYFDNMNEFFGANHYDIVDRNNLTKEEVNFANVWGVADDDLFRRTMKENDKAHAEGKPFFDMLMTTSNHRPYTYPDGKIDLPSKTSGRWGGVKFTDFAIDEFLKESKKHAWFNNTIFVIVADHTAGSSGKSELDPKKYHIPMWIYAPGIVKPAKADWMASQIDIAPTILGLMGVEYESQFYGKDLLKEKPERAFISNYQNLGYLTQNGLVILKPMEQADFFTRSQNGEYKKQGQVPPDLLSEAIGYYQGASNWKTWSKKQPE